MSDHSDDQQPSTSTSKDAQSVVSTKRKGPEHRIRLSVENRPIKLVKKPAVVLDEDDFTNNLEKIIVRDYFPEVPRIKAQKEYLEAVTNNDVEKIRELQLRFSSKFTNQSGERMVRRPMLNSGRFDVDTDLEEMVVNPEGLNEDEEDPNKSGIDVDKHTVQSFVDTYISEDSKSFHELMEYDAKKHRTRFDWIYKAEQRHNAELIEQGKPMIQEADEQLVQRRGPDDERPNQADNWSYKAKNSVLFPAEGAAPTLREFMDTVKNDGGKLINKAATRIDTSTLNWKDKPTPTNTFASTKVDITGKQQNIRDNVAGQFQPIDTPNPTIGPGDSPLITWGQIAGTPFRLDGSDVTPLPDNVPQFKLPEMTKRELIAHEMADKLKRQNKEKKMFSKRMTDKLRDPHTRLSTASRMSLLSPAAHQLAGTKLGIKTRNTGTITKKTTPSSVRIPSLSLRRTPRTTEDLKTPASSSIRLEPMESVINENLLSVRKQKHPFH